MTFDPFGDFESRGYLRNLTSEKDPEIVRHLEHVSFMTGIDEAIDYLTARDPLTYEDVLATHKILFGAMYPWAGQDRTKTAPDIAVSKGNVLFAHPDDIKRSISFALTNGHDKTFMTSRPGEVMGYLAYGHPFLDGNGRARSHFRSWEIHEERICSSFGTPAALAATAGSLSCFPALNNDCTIGPR